ncbi:MAG: hypothetical protein ABSC06_35505 [Rhodopila sp.]|jgi:hypothetical protein
MKNRFDLNELARSGPATDDEREQARCRQPWAILWPPLTEENEDEVLRQIRELKHKSLRSENAGPGDAKLALQHAAQLFQSLVGWAAAGQMQLSYADVALAQSTRDPVLHRDLAAKSLALPLPLMPPNTQRVVAEAIDQLLDGTVDPVLKPTPGGRRGIAPRWRSEIELTLLAWIEWQVASGKLRVGQAQTAVAQACGLETTRIVQKWKKEIKGKLGEKTVNEWLEAARQIGRMEVEGADPSAHPELKALARKLRSQDIGVLGKRRQRASVSRTVTL